MKKRHLAAASAAVLSVFISNIANAIPIRFEFAGTVTSATSDVTSYLGQAMSAFIAFDTDNLQFSSSANPVTSLNYTDRPTVPGPSAFTSGATVAGNALPTEGVFNEGRVNFFDGCTPDCLPGYGESFSLWTNSRGLPVTGVPDGRYYEVALTFISVAPYDFMTGTFSNYFDITPDFDVTSVLTLPITDATGFWDANVWDCVQGACTSSKSFLGFHIDSVTRSSMSVPEPDTLAMFGAALAGLMFLRRPRRVTRR